MNILFVNYGDFTTNSLNHIGAFANALSAAGHACAVAVPFGKETLGVVLNPLFVPVLCDEALARPALFPDGRGADVIHAWTPREWVRKFVLRYQAAAPVPARLVVHLEDNEVELLESYTHRTLAELRAADPADTKALLTDSLSHPLRVHNLLRLADAVTVIIDKLAETVPAGPEVQVLLPGVDSGLYRPAPPDEALRRDLGIAAGERVITFTGSTTFANEPEMRELYLAVALLNGSGVPTRLIRTGFTSPQFRQSLPGNVHAHVLDLGLIDKQRLPALLALADVLVHPGRPGAFNDFRLPSKLPEFFASGRPVILPATNIAHRLRDGIDALLLRTGTPDEIAAMCRRVFDDPALAARLGENGAAFARAHFDLKTNTAQLAAIYEGTCARPSRAPWERLRPLGTSDVSLLLETSIGTPPAVGDVAEDLVQQIRLLEQDAVELSVRESELKQLETQLVETRQHAANLTALLEQARKDHALTEQHARNLETELGFTRQHLNNQQTELAIIRERTTELKVQLALSDRKSAELQTHLDAAQRDAAEFRRETSEQIHLLGARIQAAGQEREILEHRLRQREEKIERMQRSFSWQVTAPLRALRRALFDRRPVAAPPSPSGNAAATTSSSAGMQPEPERVHFRVDEPRGWTDLATTRIAVRGWFLADPAGRVSAPAIRAAVGERVFPAKNQLPRADVKAAFPGHPGALNAGFMVEVIISPPRANLALEYQRPDGSWARFFDSPVTLAPDATDNPQDPYQRWIKRNEDHSVPALDRLRAEAANWANPPRFSITMPVFNTPERWLRRAIESVLAQTWPHWELCIADDASPAAHVRQVIEDCARADTRIKTVFRSTNGHISAASNSALELATGEWITLLDHDDELAPDALSEMAAAIRAHPEADLYYSDEDKIDEAGARFSPYFKPDFLPDLFLGQNFISHLAVYRTSIVRQIGGFRVGFEGSQDWDLALRFVEQTTPGRIRHIPRILYHWRSIPGSTALLLSEKSYPVEAARKALAEHLDRTGQRAALVAVEGGHWRVRHTLPEPAPFVSLIIPTRNGLHLLKRCVESIVAKSTYPAYGIIIVDNGSDDAATQAWLREIVRENEIAASPGSNSSLLTSAATHSAIGNRHSAFPPTPSLPQIRILRDERPFNFSALNNAAVAHAHGEFVGLINNDLEVITPDWLEEMVAHAARPGVGCVGAMLYYPDNTIQHAGAVLGVGGVAGHAFKRFPRGTEGVFNRARLVQNYSAVTAACLVVRKSTYERVGGLGEKKLAVAFNDIDFCLKVRAAGFRNVWTPFAELYHHESASRGFEDTPEKHDRFRREIDTMKERWGDLLRADPAYNPNLTLEHEDFSIAEKPRVPSEVEQTTNS